ncbi:hypothetical protein C3Y98_04325 [Methylotenera oryzisoli]|uniref:Uncharacterized protein n=1 Tax=Methylotenera oryzisoli TaxID=2080758 RepID=A0A4Y9VUJ2_9PROT|nr:hypothetical protein [Methylotenera oryzisoli]TFW72337.1 hypothetical protein C3Y98_04325 [Methylotenera oryzisoli]
MSVTREKLYEEIWAEPITTVSKRYGVSDSYLIRILKSLNIPRPPRGYWAMVAADIHPEKPSLPKARLGDAITWSRDGRVEYATDTSLESKTVKSFKLDPRTSTHRLVQEAREHFKNVRDSRSAYLKPNKKLVIDLIVSKGCLEHALDVTNQLFLMLENLGHPVVFAPPNQYFHRADIKELKESTSSLDYSTPWSPCRPTVVYIQDIGIGLTVFETSEEVEVGYLNGEFIPIAEYWQHPKVKNKSVYTWTTKESRPSGRLCIQAYSTYPGTHWIKQWKESKPGEISKKLQPIVKELCDSVTKVVEATKVAIQEAEERQRKWDVQREKDRIEAEERRRAQNLKDSQDELFKIIEAWAEAKRIDEFFKDAQLRTTELSESDRQTVERRLTEARKLLGTLDALDRFKEWRSPEER